MHFKSLLHVRDHAKVQGTAGHLLEYIALHVNYHTGEAFELTVDRLAHRLDVTPQWVGQLRRRLVEAGELIVKQSRGRHPNVYVIPWERCPACQGEDRDREVRGAVDPDDFNPKVECGVEVPNPKVPAAQPQSQPRPTPNSSPANPKLREGSSPQLARIAPQKDSKETRERKDPATPNFHIDGLNKPETRNPWWCPAHGFCHGEHLPDHRPDCLVEAGVWPEGPP